MITCVFIEGHFSDTQFISKGEFVIRSFLIRLSRCKSIFSQRVIQNHKRLINIICMKIAMTPQMQFLSWRIMEISVKMAQNTAPQMTPNAIMKGHAGIIPSIPLFLEQLLDAQKMPTLLQNTRDQMARRPKHPGFNSLSSSATLSVSTGVCPTSFDFSIRKERK